MNRLTPTLVATGLVTACLFVFGQIVDDYLLRVIVKPIPVLVMAALVFMVSRRHTDSILVIVGLVCSSFGDLFLELDMGPTFLLGMIAFLLGHLAYVAAYTTRTTRISGGLEPGPLALVPFVVWVVWAISHVWGGLGELRWPVVVYTGVIAVMMWRATVMVSAHPKPNVWTWCALAGAVSFGFSDTLIALDKFGSPIDGVRIPIIATYWLGQALIAASVLDAPSGQGSGVTA